MEDTEKLGSDFRTSLTTLLAIDTPEIGSGNGPIINIDTFSFKIVIIYIDDTG